MMERIRTLVCDDEPDAREGLLELVGADPEIAVVGEARDGAEAVSAMTATEPELVFLDVQMPRLDGFGVIDALSHAVGPERLPVIVFVTAYDEYALRAFEVHALDYLLKPYSEERLAEALRVAKERVRQRRAGVLARELAGLLGDARWPAASRDAPSAAAAPASPAAPHYLERIPVRIAQKLHFVPVGDIDWIEADDYCARLHVGGKTYVIRETLNQLDAALDPSRFVRVHRSAIVNVARVKLLHPYAGGRHVITLVDGTQVPLSRSRRADFEHALGSRL